MFVAMGMCGQCVGGFLNVLQLIRKFISLKPTMSIVLVHVIFTHILCCALIKLM